MTAEEFAAVIGAEFDVLGSPSLGARYLEASARSRVLGAGREYAHSDEVQGFEQRHPAMLLQEVEAELADAAAWAVALSIRMSRMDHPIWITNYLRGLASLMGEVAIWRAEARTVRTGS